MHKKKTYDNASTISPRITVVGSGYWGKNLVRNFYELGALYAICDKDPHVRTAFKELYPEVQSLANLNVLLDNNSSPVNAVAIATPAATHYELAKRCLLAGKHVFV